MTFNLFDILFVNGSYKDAFDRLSNGEFMVVPSGPGLATIDKDELYYNALKNADFAIPDSGFMIILARLFYNLKINKLSGLKFLRKFIDEEILRRDNVLFSVEPNIAESIKNRNYLSSKGVAITSEYQYISPYYKKDNIIDDKLLEILESLQDKPKFLLLNIGGGVQERLGYYIKNNLSYKIGIICTGAAIAFETGSQAKLPKWIDEIYLGWLARTIQHPQQFATRFLKAFRLLYVFYLCKTKKCL